MSKSIIKDNNMRQWIIDTKYKMRLVDDKEMTDTYLAAKTMYRECGQRGKLGILYVANGMNITMSEAAHRVRLDVTKLDYIEGQGV